MVGNFLVGVIYMAIVAVIVSPNTKFAQIFTDVTDSLASLTQAAISGSVS